MTDLVEHRPFRLLAAAAVDGRISVDEAEQLERHLASCSLCRLDQAAMLRDHQWLATPARVTPPHPRVRATVMREAQGKRAPMGTWLPLVAAALVVAVASTAALAAWTGWGSRGAGTPSNPDRPMVSLFTGGLISQRLANGWIVRAPAALPGDGPMNAFDGSTRTRWNSGTYAPQWIEVDLGRTVSISAILLLTDQTPAGQTRHEIAVLDETRHVLDDVVLDGFTTSMTWLRHDWPAPIAGARYVRITTLVSPSWVAWWDIALTIDGG